MRIKIKTSTMASGTPLNAGQVADVPDEVSAADAAILIGMGRAVSLSCTKPAALAPSEAKPKTTRKPRRKNKV